MYQKTIRAGRITEVIRHQRKPARSHTRRPHSGTTSAGQRQINARQARLRIGRLLNANFAPGDRFVTLTYASDPTPETAQRAVDTFVKRLQRVYKKLKYVAKTETKPRIHHHFLLKNNVDYATICAIWGAGYIQSTAITSEDLSDIANYLIKEKREDGRNYIRHSRSLKQPKVEEKTIQRERRPRGNMILERFSDSNFYGRTSYQKIKSYKVVTDKSQSVEKH